MKTQAAICAAFSFAFTPPSQVAAGHDVSLDAGRDLTVESATGGTAYDADSMSASAGGGLKVNFGTNGMGAGVNVYASLGGSGSDYEAIYHRNAAVAARNDLTTKSGADTTIAGARVQGSTVTMNVGDDLVVASRQDESDGGSHSFGVSADVMLGIGASGSISVNAGKGESSSGWVREQTAIIGKEKVDIRVEDNTHVEGAVIAAENGNLKLDTNTLTYADIKDHDKASNINIGVSVSGSHGGGGYSTQKSWGELLGTDSGGGKPTTGAAGSKDGDNKDGDKSQGVPNSVTVDYSDRDRRQINRATIGEGAIIIRSNPDAGLEGLNRDLARAQEITKDSETVVSVYIDPAAMRAVIDLLNKALTSTDEAQVALAQATGAELVKRGLLPEEVWNALANWKNMSAEERKAAQQNLQDIQAMPQEAQAGFVDGLSTSERVGLAAYSLIQLGKSSSNDQKGEFLRLATMAIVGGETYRIYSEVNSDREYADLAPNAEDFLPVNFWKEESQNVDKLTTQLESDENRQLATNYFDSFRTASNNDEKLTAIAGMASVFSVFLGLSDVQVRVADPKPGASAYATVNMVNEARPFLSDKLTVTSDNVIYIPADSPLLNGAMDFKSVAEVLVHEMVHMKQVDIMNAQIKGNTSAMGGLLLVDQMINASIGSSYGLYRVRPREAHAYAFSKNLVENLDGRGFFNENR